MQTFFKSIKVTLLHLTFNKGERLKSRKTIDTLFVQNKSIKIYPFKIIWMSEPNNNIFSLKMGVSVSKKQFKSAVKRNLIKRKMRECIRLNKPLIQTKLHDKQIILSFMIIYLGSEVVPHSEFDDKIKQLFIRLSEMIIKK